MNLVCVAIDNDNLTAGHQYNVHDARTNYEYEYLIHNDRGQYRWYPATAFEVRL